MGARARRGKLPREIPHPAELRRDRDDAFKESLQESSRLVVAQFDDLYHEGHEVTRRRHLQIKPFVTLRVLRGSWFFSSSVKLIHYFPFPFLSFPPAPH